MTEIALASTNYLFHEKQYLILACMTFHTDVVAMQGDGQCTLIIIIGLYLPIVHFWDHVVLLVYTSATMNHFYPICHNRNCKRTSKKYLLYLDRPIRNNIQGHQKEVNLVCTFYYE